MWFVNTGLWKLVSLVFLLLFSASKTKCNNNFFNFKTPLPLLSLSLGFHEISVGFHFECSLQIPYTHFTFQNSTRYYFKAPGCQKKGFESRFEGGVNLGINPRIDSLQVELGTNQWSFKNQLGYAYVYYWDQFETSQASGIFSLKVGAFHYQIENDFFAFQKKDRYRTGAFYAGWQIKNQFIYIKNIGYTGDPYAKGVPWIKDTNFPSKYGYTDMRKAPLGNKSLGVLSIGWASTLLSPNLFAIEAGVDAEQIRNYFQNRLIHDSKWLNKPEKGAVNPHIPMLDLNDDPYLYLPAQSIRKHKPYIQIFFNDFFLY